MNFLIRVAEVTVENLDSRAVQGFRYEVIIKYP